MKKLKVLVVTLPERGHYHPLLGPVAELVRRGHEVVVAATCDVADELRAAGVDRIAIPPGAPPPSTALRGEELARVLVDPPRLADWIRELLVEAPRRGVEPLRAILREVQPDVVAIDTMAYDAAIAAELAGVPWVGWATSLNPVVADDTDSQLVRTLRALDGERQAVFADHGLAARFRVSDVLSPRGTAVFATEALVGPAFGGVVDETVHLVGPSLGGRRGGERVDLGFVGDRAVVYASFGSQAWYQPARFARLAAACARFDLALVAPMGRHVDQLELLPRVHGFVTHGGANSVMEACAFGVPMLVAPICNDQPHAAAFVERAGAGLAVDLETASDATLDCMLRLDCSAVRESYARDGSVGAADLVEHAR
ncbi:MAG: glycosyltransferase [Proteobacteria bacterium]|nr:glycosyltransferase [Pseudomonadota bacterium]